MAHQKVPVMPAILTTVLAATLAAVPTTTASADDIPTQMTVTTLATPDTTGVNVRAGTSTASEVVTVLEPGQEVTIGCWKVGQQITGPYGISMYWYQVAGDPGQWVSDAFLWTGSNVPVTKVCDDPTPVSSRTEQEMATASEPAQEQPQAGTATSYNPEAAKSWAKQHWNDDARYGENNCTWFASQVLWNGGLTKTEEWTDYSMDYGGRLAPVKKFFGHHEPTEAAIVADRLYQYLIKNGNEKRDIAWSDNTAAGASIGDLIFYDLKINGQYDIDHVAVVTGFTEDGYPLVTQHGQDDKPWSWGNKDGNVGWVQDVYRSDGWGEPQAYLIKITQ